MEWSTACPDWEERILAGKSLVPCPPLFPGEAEAALAIFKALRMVDAPGSPEMGVIARQWVFDFVAAIFGAYDAETGRRLINDFFLLISKKNGKSTTAAGIMLVALLMNWRMSAEMTILAPTIEVAKNSSDPAMKMVAQDPELLALLRPIPHLRMIEHRTTGATLKIVAANERVVGGSKSSFVLIDEYWLFGKMPNAESMLLEATGGLTSRPEGFVIKLSTHSDEPPAGVFKDDLHRFRDIRDGKIIAPRSLGVMYEMPRSMIESGKYKDPKNFYITNPNLNASVDEQVLLDKLAKAQQAGRHAVAGFFAKHLNVEIGMGLRSDRWPGAEYWEQQADPVITLDEILRRCEVVIVGVDGGGLDDLLGATVLGREAREVTIDVVDEQGVTTKKTTKRWLSWSKAWAHESVLDRRKSIASLLTDLDKAGEIRIVKLQTMAVSEFVALVQKVKDSGLLYCVAADPMGLGTIVDELALIDVTQQNKESEANFIIGVAQGIGMMSALKTVENKAADGTFVHADQKLMDWAVGNLKIEPTATAIRATKQNVGDAKIDPAMALFNAAQVMSTNPEASRSVFDQLGDPDDAQAPAEEAQADDIDMEILRDPKHPRWQEMRERYEAKLAAQDTEEY